MKKTLLLCTLLMPMAAAAQDTALSLYTESYEPYSFMEGEKLTGHAVDLVAETLLRKPCRGLMSRPAWS
ncbi:MAG: hypothetical protein GY883_11270 [Shimia sp.]|nr:hypothetical protein [Shimia sp.]